MKSRTFNFGEAALWVAFAFFSAMVPDGQMDGAVTMAGICAFAAVGIRATRPEVAARVNDDAA